MSGDELAPAWVDWRYGGDNVGWAPLPPDDMMAAYDDRPDYWMFVPMRYIGEPGLHYRRWPGQSTAQAAHTDPVQMATRVRLIEQRASARSHHWTSVITSSALCTTVSPVNGPYSVACPSYDPL